MKAMAVIDIIVESHRWACDGKWKHEFFNETRRK